MPDEIKSPSDIFKDLQGSIIFFPTTKEISLSISQIWTNGSCKIQTVNLLFNEYRHYVFMDEL